MALVNSVLKTSMKRDSITCLDNLLVFFIFSKVFPYCNLRPFCLVLLLYLSKESDSVFLVSSSKVLEDCYKMPLKLFLQAEQAQLPVLNSLQFISILLVLLGPKLNATFYMQSDKC